MRKQVSVTGSSRRPDKEMTASAVFLMPENIRQVIFESGGLC
jgi:hypothetical protein